MYKRQPQPAVAPAEPVAEMLGKRPNSLACCPRCGAGGLVRKEGCDTCFECGYSKCS